MSTYRCVHLCGDESDAGPSDWQQHYVDHHNEQQTAWEKGYCRTVSVRAHRAPITAIALCGEHVVSGCANGQLKVWDSQGSEARGTPLSGHYEEVTGLDVRGSVLVSSSKDRDVRVWNVRSRSLFARLEGHTDWVKHAVLGMHQIASCSRDTTVRIWDIISGRCESVLGAHEAAVWCLSFGDEPYSLFSADTAGVVARWDLRQEAPADIGRKHRDFVRAMATTGHLLATGAHDGSLCVTDTRKMSHVLHQLSGLHSECITGVQYMKRNLLSCSSDGQIQLTAGGSRIRTFRSFNSANLRRALPDRPPVDQSFDMKAVGCREAGVVVTNSLSSRASVWDFHSGMIGWHLDTPAPVSHVLCDRSTLVAAAAEELSISTFDPDLAVENQ